jgi:hypothetical protein
MFAIYARENESPWRAGGTDAERALETLEANPFAPFEEMLLDDDMDWRPFDRALALRALAAREESAVAFRASRPFPLRASVFRHPLYNLLQLEVADEYVKEPGALAAAVEFTEKLARTPQAFSYGGASADMTVHDFYVSRDMAFLPDCFGYVGWYHLLAPRGYEPFFEPEDLRHLPAHRVEERDDGTFAIASYEDPFKYEDAAARARIVEMTDYLNERRKDWKEDW